MSRYKRKPTSVTTKEHSKKRKCDANEESESRVIWVVSPLVRPKDMTLFSSHVLAKQHVLKEVINSIKFTLSVEDIKPILGDVAPELVAWWLRIYNLKEQHEIDLHQKFDLYEQSGPWWCRGLDPVQYRKGQRESSRSKTRMALEKERLRAQFHDHKLQMVDAKTVAHVLLDLHHHHTVFMRDLLPIIHTYLGPVNKLICERPNDCQTLYEQLELFTDHHPPLPDQADVLDTVFYRLMKRPNLFAISDFDIFPRVIDNS